MKHLKSRSRCMGQKVCKDKVSNCRKRRVKLTRWAFAPAVTGIRCALSLSLLHAPPFRRCTCGVLFLTAGVKRSNASWRALYTVFNRDIAENLKYCQKCQLQNDTVSDLSDSKPSAFSLFFQYVSSFDAFWNLHINSHTESFSFWVWKH